MVAAVGLLVCLIGAPAQAQGGVDVELEIGFANRYAPGQWTPVSVVVESAQAISGTLEVTYDQPDGADSLHAVGIEVPGGGRKQFHLVVPGPTDNTRVTAQVVADDTVLGAAAESPLPLEETALIGVIGDPSAIDSFTVEPSLTEMIPVQVSEGQLDLGAPALAALSYVVAQSDDLAALVPEQRDTLGDWIATRGRLLVVDEDPSGLPWPPAATGIEWSGGQVAEGGSSLAGGRVALVAEGLGQVMVMRGRLGSLDRDVVEKALRPPPAAYSAGSQEFFSDFGPETSADSALMNRMRGRGGSLRLSWFVGFLVVYLVLVGPANYFVLKRRGRKELLWVTVPALALLFSGVAYGLARGSRGGLDAATAGVVFATESGQQGRAVAVVSSGTGGERTFSFPTKAAVAPRFLPFFGSNQRGSTRLTAEGAEVTLETAPFSMHFARGTLDRFDGFIDIQLTTRGDASRYRAVNKTPHTLTDVNLVFGSVAVELEDMEPGASASGNVPPLDARRQRFRRVLPGGLRNALLSEIRALLGPSSFSRPLAVATVPDYDMGIALDGRAHGDAGRFLLASPIEVAGDGGGAVGSWTGQVDIVSTDGHVMQYNPAALSLEGFQEAVFSYEPPPGLDRSSITGGKVTFLSGGPRQNLERYDWPTERWVEIKGDRGNRLVEDLPRGAFSESGEAYFRLKSNRHGFAEILRFEVEPVIG